MNTPSSPAGVSHTCVSMLTTAVPRISPDKTIADAEKYLLTHAKKLESINYLYITGENNRLLGAISIKDLFRYPKQDKLSGIMVTSLITARPHTKLERAAYLAVANNIKAIPVVDKEDKLVGVITNDVIVDTLYREMHANIFSMAGVRHPRHALYHGDSVLRLPILTSVGHRIPWLIVGLLGGLVISKIIQNFEDTIGPNILIASFIPLVVYMANAIGIQMEAYVIRDFAINPNIKFIPYFLRHVVIVAILGLLISYIFFWGTAFIYHEYQFALVVSSALFVAILSSLFTGLMIPHIFEKMKMDPASAGGPVGTILQDGLSVIIYLSIASRLL